MRVIGLDLSLTASGVALEHDETVTLTSKQKGVDRLRELRAAILCLCGDPMYLSHPHHDPADLVVIEGYSFSSRNSHAHGLGELGGVIRLALADARIPYVDVPPASLKKYATGKGNASKGDVLVAAVKRLAYDGSSDNEADALWLREIGVAHIHPSAAADMPLLHRTALDALTFPAGLRTIDRADDFLTRTEGAA
jgi:Holliday junction resolvasome RuvABC endonuclease subunit